MARLHSCRGVTAAAAVGGWRGGNTKHHVWGQVAHKHVEQLTFPASDGGFAALLGWAPSHLVMFVLVLFWSAWRPGHPCQAPVRRSSHPSV